MYLIGVDYVDHGVNGEYGFFGKRVAYSNVEHYTADEVDKEIAEMKCVLGVHVVAVPVYEIPAIA